MARKRVYKGMGFLYIRGKDGRDYPADSKAEGAFYVRSTGADGHRKRTRLKATTLKEARSEQARLFGSGESSRLPNERLTMSDAWQVFLDSPRRRESSKKNLYYFRSYWFRLSDSLGGDDTEVAKIRPEDLTRHFRALSAGGTNLSTIASIQRRIKFIFKILVSDGRLSKNPSDGIPTTRFSYQGRRELTSEEVQLVLAGATGWLKPLFYIGAYTGMRLGDCATLRWREVDFLHGVITRKPFKTTRSSGVIVRVGIAKSLREVLETLPRTGEYVVPEAARYFLKPSGSATLSRITQKVFLSCGIQTLEYEKGLKKPHVIVGFHSLRHTWVSHQLEQGTPTTVVQMAVGHINPDMTARYAHTTPQMLRAMAERGEFSDNPLRRMVEDRMVNATDDEISRVAEVLGIKQDTGKASP